MTQSPDVPSADEDPVGASLSDARMDAVLEMDASEGLDRGAEAASGGSAAADLLDRATDGLLSLAADRPWRDITLRDVAERAGVGFAELYARTPSKAALLWRLSARFDRQAFEAAAADAQPAPRDRLFEAFMARLEAMEPHRAVLIVLARGAGSGVLGPRLPVTARGLLEASGVDTSGGRGALRVAAFTAVWARVLQVWRDDEGALNRTMAEIDKLLARTEKRLARVGAGF